ncbi:MAG: hypothetical protein ABW321_32745 [Polyangiales bacterium]
MRRLPPPTSQPRSRPSRRRLLVAGVLSTLGWLASAGAPSQAQGQSSERWLFVPVLSGARNAELAITPITSPLEIELRARGQQALSNADAGTLFEVRHSSEPVKLNTDELSRLLHSVGLAARHLALGELPQAQQAMEGVYALSGPARDYLNREAARARKIFDTCLMTAYLWEREHKRPEALRQMRECSRNFPGFRPEGHAYPPEVREVFALAKQQVNREPETTLLVQSRESAGCGVRLNGIEVGRSPMSFSDVRSGITRIQLECRAGVAGRIHPVDLQPGPNHLDIDPSFDAAVHSHDGLWLQYDNDGERAARVDADLQQLQRALGPLRVVGLLLDARAPHTVRVRTIGEPPSDVTQLAYSLSAGYPPAELAAAVDLLTPKPITTSAVSDGPRPIRLDPPSTTVEEPAPSVLAPATQSQPQLLAGILLAAAGSGGLATGWILYTMRHQFRVEALSLDDDADVDSMEVRPAKHYPPSGWTLAAAGAGLSVLTLSEYFWLPPARGVPAIAWVMGGLGVAVVATGIVLALLGPRCNDLATASFPPECGAFNGDTIFGPLIALHALPLVNVPITYALRAAGDADVHQAQLALDVGWNGAAGFSLRMRGAF